MKIYYLILVVALLWACNPITRQAKKNAPADDRIDLPDEFRQTSFINFPIVVSMDTVRQRVISELPDYIEVDDEIPCPQVPLPGSKKCRIEGRIYIDSVLVNGLGSLISMTTSLRGVITFHIKYAAEVEILGRNLGHTDSLSKNVFLEGDLLLDARPAILGDWSVQANLDGDLDVKEAYFYLGPRINIRNLIEAELDPVIDEEVAKINEEVSREYNLKPWITPYWYELRHPMKLLDTPLVWMHVLPERISVSSLQANDDWAMLNLGANMQLTTYLSRRPDTLVLDSLPDLEQSLLDKQQLDLSIPVSITYARLGEIFRDNMVGHVFEVDKDTRFTVRDLQVTSSQSELILAVDFTSNRKGKEAEGILYLKGLPLLEPGSQILRVVNMDFDLKTRNFLLRMADWLLYSSIVEQIEDQAIYNLHPYLKDIESEITPLLCDYTIDDRLQLRGQLDEVRVSNLYLSDSFVLLVLDVSGSTSLEVIDLRF